MRSILISLLPLLLLRSIFFAAHDVYPFASIQAQLQQQTSVHIAYNNHQSPFKRVRNEDEKLHGKNTISQQATPVLIAVVLQKTFPSDFILLKSPDSSPPLKPPSA